MERGSTWVGEEAELGGCWGMRRAGEGGPEAGWGGEAGPGAPGWTGVQGAPRKIRLDLGPERHVMQLL